MCCVFLMLQTHYRSPLDFSDERLDEAASALSASRTPKRNLDWQMKNAQDVPARLTSGYPEAGSPRVERRPGHGRRLQRSARTGRGVRPGRFREHRSGQDALPALRCSRRAQSARDHPPRSCACSAWRLLPGLGGRAGVMRIRPRSSTWRNRLPATRDRMLMRLSTLLDARACRACREELGCGRCRARWPYGAGLHHRGYPSGRSCQLRPLRGQVG